MDLKRATATATATTTTTTTIAIILLVCVATVRPAAAQQELPDTYKDSWIFDYPTDALKRDGALLNLRNLNDTEAGEHGFLKRTDDGNAFVFADGTAARFWAVNVMLETDPDAIDRRARFLAKVGVNMVRIHTDLVAHGQDTEIEQVDQPTIDAIWRTVAANKKQGIYTTISPWWAKASMIGGGPSPKWGIDGYAPGSDLWTMIFFNPQLQRGYKAWVKALYAPKNPYTGIPLADDPAVGIIQVQNEDGLLWWPIDSLQPPQKLMLSGQFAQWLTAMHGSVAKALDAWQGDTVSGDDASLNQVALLSIGEATKELTGGRAARMRDQIEFLTTTQRNFYADIVNYYRKDLGCKQLINASNWITVSPQRLNDLERWTYTSGDIVAINRYYHSGAHINPSNQRYAGWRIGPSDFHNDISATKNPRNFPLELKQVDGYPMMVTESGWISPLEYQSEAPLMVSAYQSLIGVDAFYWFVVDAAEYQTDPYVPVIKSQDQRLLFKWTVSTPNIVGQFPAAALAYRKGYVKAGEPAVVEARTMEDLFERRIPAISEDRSFDPNRNPGTGADLGENKSAITPLAFLVGPIVVKYGATESTRTTIDLSKFIDTKKKIVRSDTDQIVLDYGVGLCTVDAPNVKGVTGFLTDAGGKFALSDCTIESTNEYATVMIVSLDDQPVATSKKLLVQVGTIALPTGYATKPGTQRDRTKVLTGEIIVNTGHLPWRVKNTHVTVTLKNANLTKATRLDAGGFATKEYPMTSDANGARIELPPDAMYVILE